MTFFTAVCFIHETFLHVPPGEGVRLEFAGIAAAVLAAVLPALALIVVAGGLPQWARIDRLP